MTDPTGIPQKVQKREGTLVQFDKGKKDDLKLPIHAMEVLKKRYLLRDDNRNLIKTPGKLSTCAIEKFM